MPKAKAASSPVAFSEHHPQWAKTLQPLPWMGVRAGQQAFTKSDQKFVVDRHLPVKLKHSEKFLP